MTTIILLTIQHRYIEREGGGGGGAGAIMSPNDLSFLHSFPTSFTYQFPSLFLPSHFSFTSLLSPVFPSFFSFVFHLLRWFLNHVRMTGDYHYCGVHFSDAVSSAWVIFAEWFWPRVLGFYIALSVAYITYRQILRRASMLFQLYPSTACNADWWEMYRQSSFSQIRLHTISWLITAL